MTWQQEFRDWVARQDRRRSEPLAVRFDATCPGCGKRAPADLIVSRGQVSHHWHRACWNSEMRRRDRRRALAKAGRR